MAAQLPPAVNRPSFARTPTARPRPTGRRPAASRCIPRTRADSCSRFVSQHAREDRTEKAGWSHDCHRSKEETERAPAQRAREHGRIDGLRPTQGQGEHAGCGALASPRPREPAHAEQPAARDRPRTERPRAEKARTGFRSGSRTKSPLRSCWLTDGRSLAAAAIKLPRPRG